jgi:hypothetical protein
VLHTTLFGNTPTSATICGTEGSVTLPGPFYQPGDLVFRPIDGEEERYTEEPVAHDALHFEAAEVARRISAGELESPLRPLADSVVTMRVLDEIRAQCGITFP